MDGMIGFLLGAFMGSVFGVFIMALAVVAKDSDGWTMETGGWKHEENDKSRND